MNAREALREGAAALSGTETPFLDASLILARALGTDRARLLAAGPEPLGDMPLHNYREGLASRAAGLPLAYILGYKEFWGRRFAVDPRVLVPRPDTEVLVEAALRLGDSLAGSEDGAERGAAPRVHEACCGSGCVALSVAAERPAWEVSASDLSEDALDVARANAVSLIAPERRGGPVAFALGDLLASAGEGFDLILANPPYVPAEEAARLARGWSEPLMALDGGADGLELIRRLVPQAARALAPGGYLLVEADGGQAEAVAELFRASRLEGVGSLTDLGGRARATVGRKPCTI